MLLDAFINCCRVLAGYLAGYQLHPDAFSVDNIPLLNSHVLCVTAALI